MHKGPLRTAIAAVASILAPPDVSRAEPASAPTEEGASYATQTLLVDGVSIALVATGALIGLGGGSDASFNALAIPGFAGYALGAPIVHASHHDWGTAGGQPRHGRHVSPSADPAHRGAAIAVMDAF